MANDNTRDGVQNSGQNRPRRRSFTSTHQVRRSGARLPSQRPMSNSVAGQTVQSKTPEPTREEERHIQPTREEERSIQPTREQLVKGRRISSKLSSVFGGIHQKTKTINRNLEQAQKEAKRILRDDKDGVLKKSKSIVDGYCSAYEKLVIDCLNALNSIARQYDITLLERFDTRYYQMAFSHLKSLSRSLNHIMMSRISILHIVKQGLNNVLGQYLAGGALDQGDGFIDPFTYFVQSLARIEIFLRDLADHLYVEGGKEPAYSWIANQKAECKQQNYYELKELNNIDYLKSYVNRMKFMIKLGDLAKKIKELLLTINSKQKQVDPNFSKTTDLLALAGLFRNKAGGVR